MLKTACDHTLCFWFGQDCSDATCKAADLKPYQASCHAFVLQRVKKVEVFTIKVNTTDVKFRAIETNTHGSIGPKKVMFFLSCFVSLSNRLKH